MQKFTLREHFSELKRRLIITLSYFVAAFAFSYYYSEEIYQILLKPLVSSSWQTKKIIYTGLTEAFVTYLKLAAFAGFLLTVPVISWQIYFFLAPGLHKSEKQIAASILVASPLLFSLGAVFVFHYIMPKAWQFFLSFENKNNILPIILEARVSEYLSLVTQLIIAFGLAFQMPVVLLLMSLLKIVNSTMLQEKRRLAIVGNFILATIFTPPDVLSQIGLALPLLLLYEFSIMLCRIVEKRG